MITWTKDNLPSDPRNWGLHRKKVLARMIKMDGPFTVETKEGVVTSQGGWLALDSSDYPYPVSAEDYNNMYEAAET